MNSILKNRTLNAIFILIVLVFTGSLHAGDPARSGTAAGVQVQVPVGARSMSLSGANLATVSGLEALYWNPAGLSGISSSAAGTVSTMTIFNDIDVNYLGLGFSMGSIGNLGFSIKAFDFGDLPITTVEDPDGASGATFSPTFATLGLTYSNRLTDAVSIGVTGKMIYESIPRATASSVAFDMGIQYEQLGGISGLSFGLAVKNIGSDMQYTGSAFLVTSVDQGAASSDFRDIPTASHKLPATIELGLGYRYNIAENNSLQLSGNFLNENFGDDAYLLGAEYMYGDFIALRGGYRLSGVESDDQLYTFTLGFGLNTSLGGTDIGFDYAFRDSQYFDGNNLFSLTLGF